MAPSPKTTTRKTAAKKPARRKAAPKAAPKIEAKPEYDPTWHATVEAYVTLRDAGAPIPDAIRKPVENWLKQEQEKQQAEAQGQAEAQAKRQQEDAQGPKWIRNNFHTEVALKLEGKEGKLRRIELKPRGQRGDIFPLKPGDENDHNLITTLAGGYVEIIGQTTAEEVVHKQTQNIQKVHQPLAILRNERGEAGLDGQGMKLTVEQEFNKQGVVVGVINEDANPAKDKFGGIQRPHQVQQFVPTGGNPAIVSSGFKQADPNAQAAIADDLARRARGANVGRPEDALGLSVTVAPPVKT